MKLQQLVYVTKVAECGSITEAARRLYVSQPSITSAIHDLEQEMNVHIFDRTNKGVVVSEEGETFLGYARQVLEQTELLEDKYKNPAQRVPHFSVSCQHYSFAVNAFVEVVKEYDADQYGFILRETQTGEIIDDVAAGRSELGIMYLCESNETVLTKLLLTDSRMYIKVVNTRLEAEVVPGDIVQSGIIISNSEVGLGSVSIQPLVYRLVCSNGMVVNDAQTRRNHVGRVNEASENYQLYSEKTLEADDKAFAMKIQDTVRAVVDEVRFTRVVNMMREAKDAPMNTAAVPGIVKLVSKDFHITDDESSGVLQRLIEGNDLTLYGLSNAVTRHSQDVKDYDRATALEGIGYNILSMPARQWSRINQMAA